MLKAIQLSVGVVSIVAAGAVHASPCVDQQTVSTTPSLETLLEATATPVQSDAGQAVTPQKQDRPMILAGFGSWAG